MSETQEAKELVEIPTTMKAADFQNPAFYDEVRDAIKGVIEQAGTFDPENPEDRDRAKSLAYKISRSKTALEDIRKRITADWRSKIEGINSTGKKFVEMLDGFRDEVKGPVVEWEKKQAEREAEFKARIERFRSAATVAIDTTAADIRARLESIKSIAVDDTWGEFAVPAREAQQTAIGQLENYLGIAEQREKEAAELAELRAKQQADAAAQAEAQHPIEKAVDMTKAAEPAEPATDGQRVEAFRDAQADIIQHFGLDQGTSERMLMAIMNKEIPYLRFSQEK